MTKKEKKEKGQLYDASLLATSKKKRTSKQASVGEDIIITKPADSTTRIVKAKG